MKRFILLVAAFFILGHISAQSVAVGERAPELRVKQWLTAPPQEGKKITLIEFFSPANPVCVARLEVLDSIAADNAERLRVIVVVKENNIERTANLAKVKYSVALDSEMKIFKAFGIRFVPSGVIIDAKGKVLWMGNTSSINGRTIKQLIYDGFDKDRPLRK
mgnify:CR=1 FL=1